MEKLTSFGNTLWKIYYNRQDPDALMISRTSVRELRIRSRLESFDDPFLGFGYVETDFDPIQLDPTLRLVGGGGNTKPRISPIVAMFIRSTCIRRAPTGLI